MRPSLNVRAFGPLSLVTIWLLLIPAAAAQDDGCTQTNPCLLDVEVDERGIASVSVTTFTAGDWYFLSASNLDARDHTLRLDGHAVVLPVVGYGFADSQPFQIAAPGTYALHDEPTGDSAQLTVVAGDAVDAEASSSARNGTPALSCCLAAVGLLGLAAAKRR